MSTQNNLKTTHAQTQSTAASTAQAKKSRRTRKIAAISAGALIVGVGATYTLASWTDTEWVWGGAVGDLPGIGTSTFEVEQLTEGTWHDDESSPGGRLDFTIDALSLTPGDSVYAPMSLRTKIGSIGGDVTMQGAVAATGITTSDTGDHLWNAVELSVYTSDAATAPSCEAATLGDWTAVEGVTSVGLSTGATPTTGAQELDAATTTVAGAPQHYCFVLHLPADAETTATESLQGRTIAPAWEFKAESA